MWRNIASTAISFLVVAIFLVGGLIVWGQNTYKAEGPSTAPICLRIERGASMRTISDQLAEQGAITSPMIFRIGADYAGKSGDRKAGSWLIPEHSTMSEITHLITRGGASTCGTEVVYRIGVTSNEVELRELDLETNRYVEKAAFDPASEEAPAIFDEVREQNDTRYRVAIAEGTTSWQIVEALKSVDVLEGEVADLPAEGTLAPDNYEVAKGDTRASLIARMTDAQEVLVAAAWASRVDGLPLKDAQEMLVLASIIEKETGLPDERRQVASVFENRLKRGMRLQTDPTVIYGLTEGKGVLGRGLRASELRKVTDWNTYVIDGLPPTPIANPGKASIEAAVDPAATDFVFFVADGSGGHAFAETLEQHNANVAKWRQIEAERTQSE
ncbi:endolytic transglycosylase MltG [Roseovarius sp. Pro17]|uniref:endolytic transglycosylase MltG n=1 Tax=Roseovarius sp. Pro17 TaxID=3108175 RepID=UPI002D778C2C|nr:endolytic transglycosylase MltG [Roseovarius sp. Pro17]